MKITLMLLSLLVSLGTMAHPSHKWEYITTDWGWGDIAPGECGDEKLKLYRSGKFVSTACRKVVHGRARQADMIRLNVVMDKLLTQFHKKMDCEGDVIFDYVWDIKVKLKGYKLRDFYESTDEGPCFRGKYLMDPEGESYYQALDIILGEISTAR